MEITEKGAEETHFLSAESLLRPQARSEWMKVAAYIRVSTDSSDQENSYETQERYFHQLLAKNDRWIFAGIYADHGFSGTDSQKRIGFTRILRHCREGRIDRIVCKSISRFARNTTDFLTALKVLGEHGVSIVFEKEALDTADPTSAFILTTLGAIAQEESRSISENILWSMHKRFPKGSVRNHILYGYRYNDRLITTDDGYQYKDIEIIAQEAAIVRRIFLAVASGEKFSSISRRLNQEGIPAPVSTYTKRRKAAPQTGQLHTELEEGWTARHISQIIRRERYTGDVIIQKTYTADFLTHKTRKNRGEMVQYLASKHHPAIIPHELYDEVQAICRINSIRYGNRRKRHARILSGLLICEECGRYYHVRNLQKSPIWFCPSTALNNGRTLCHSQKIYETQVFSLLRLAVKERFSLLAPEFAPETGRRPKHFPQTPTHSDSSRHFIQKILSQLTVLERVDSMERDCAFLKQQIAIERTGPAKPDPAPLIKRLHHMENYLKKWEESFPHRKAAIQWMKQLIDRSAEISELWEGIAGKYARAFILAITVHTPFHFTIRWFDDTQTDVRTAGKNQTIY